MMVAASWFLGDFFFGNFTPSFYDRVEIFIFFYEDGFVNNISDGIKKFISLLEADFDFFLELLTFYIKFLFFFKEISTRVFFIDFFSSSYFFIDLIFLLISSIHIKFSIFPFFIKF